MDRAAKLIIFFILLFLAAPWIEGMYVKQQFTRYLLTINNNNNFKAVLVSYHSGWFSSNSVAKVIYLNARKPEQPLELTLHCHISHGPLVYNAATDQFEFSALRMKTNIHLPAEIENKLFVNNSPGIATVLSQFYFDGTITTQVTSPTLVYHLDDATTIVWAGLRGNYRATLAYYNKLTGLQSDLWIGQLTTQKSSLSQGIQLTSKPITMKYDWNAKSSDFWVSSYHLTVPSMSYIDASGNAYQLTDLNLTYHNGTNAGMYHINDELSLAELSLPAAIHYPSIKPATIQFTATNLNSRGINSFFDFINAPETQSLTQQEAHDKMLSLIAGIATPQSVITSRADIQTSQGALTQSGLATWPKLAYGQVESFNKTAKLHFDLTVSSTLFRTLVENLYVARLQKPATTPDSAKNTPQTSAAEIADSLIAYWIKNGYLVPEGENYLITIEKDDAAFTMNGKEITTPS